MPLPLYNGVSVDYLRLTATREHVEPMAKSNPAQFVKEVRQETSKVTWPTRKETSISTVMVFFMVILAAIFFLIVDQILSWGVQSIFGLGG